MKLFKTVTDRTKDSLPKFQLGHSNPSETVQVLENNNQTDSCCIQEPQSALLVPNSPAEIESQQLFSDNNKQKVLNSQPRIPVKLEYISKVNCQESEYDISPKIEIAILDDGALKGIKKNYHAGLNDIATLEKNSNREKGKGNKEMSFLSVKRPVGQKRASFSAAGVKLFKDTFTKSWKKQQKSISEAPRFSTGKSLADVGLEAVEMDEQDQEQIKQVSRNNLNLKSVVDLKETNCPDIAQEDNPLSNGRIRISLQHSMNPAKSIEELRSHTSGLQGKLDTVNTLGSFSKIHFPIDLEGKGETKTTLSPKTNTNTILTLTSFTSKAGLKNQNTPVVLPSFKTVIEGFVEYGIILPLCFIMLYCVLPFGLLFVAHDYENKAIRIGLNFGFLGLLQGLLKVMLIHYMVDRPIMNKIKEIEGSDPASIETQKYKLLSGYKIAFMVVYAVGAQIGLGVAIEKLGFSVNPVSVLLSIILITLLGSLLWAVLVFVQNPPKIENKRKILTKELSQINKLRRDFLKELHTTRKELDQNAKALQTASLKIDTKQSTENACLAYIGVASGVQNNLKSDIKNFRCKDLSKYTEEITKLRFNVFKVYGLIIALVLELLGLMSVLKGVSLTENAAALAFLAIIPVIGALFGLIDYCKTTPRKHIISIVEIVNIILTRGAYRFFYLVAPSQGVMIGGVLLKFAVKISTNYISLFYHHNIVAFKRRNPFGRLFAKKKDSSVQFYKSNDDSKSRPIRYLLQKFLLTKIADSYFGLGTLVLIGASQSWFPQLNLGLSLIIGDFTFYIILVGIEVVIDVLLLVHFSVLAKRAAKKTSKALNISIRKELNGVVSERRLLIVVIKAMVLFLLIFIFMNQL